MKQTGLCLGTALAALLPLPDVARANDLLETAPRLTVNAAARVDGQGGWDERVNWFRFPQLKKRIDDETFYADIINHTRDYESFTKHGLLADAHENSHGIQNHLFHEYGDGGLRYGFYLGNDLAATVDQPRLRIRDCLEFLPEGLRDYRYQTYLIDSQKQWDEWPLYIYDEWVAYINSGAVGIDLVTRKAYKEGPVDAVSGCLEFMIYGAAIGMAAEKHDPNFYRTNSQFRAFSAFLTRRSMAVYQAGKQLEPFQFEPQERLYERLASSRDGEKMRDYLRRTYGDQWVRQNLGF